MTDKILILLLMSMSLPFLVNCLSEDNINDAAKLAKLRSLPDYDACFDSG